MKYPVFKSALLIHTDRAAFKLHTEKALIENLENRDTSTEVSVEVVSSDKKDMDDIDWIYNPSLFEIYIADTLMDNHISPDSKAYTDFIKNFNSILDAFKSMSQIEGIELAPFPLYYYLEYTYASKFLFHALPDRI